MDISARSHSAKYTSLEPGIKINMAMTNKAQSWRRLASFCTFASLLSAGRSENRFTCFRKLPARSHSTSSGVLLLRLMAGPMGVFDSVAGLSGSGGSFSASGFCSSKTGSGTPIPSTSEVACSLSISTWSWAFEGGGGAGLVLRADLPSELVPVRVCSRLLLSCRIP